MASFLKNHTKILFVNKFSLFFVFFLISVQIYAGGIKGSVTNEQGNPIAFSSIYIHELSKGTITGETGKFEISLDTGNYKVSFHSIGYYTESKQVNIINDWININVILKTRSYEIKEVIVNKSNEDPAYPIMRKAIALAPYYKNQVKYYRAKLYIKGNMKINKLSNFISKHSEVRINDSVNLKFKSGDSYVMESYNELVYEAPDKYHQTVISMKNSFPISDGKESLGYLTSSLYDPKIDIVVSPLSEQAFKYYKFRYEGFSWAGDYPVNKIKVIPRRKGKQVFEGCIYIVDGLWCLYSVDLINNAFFGDIAVKQIFEQIKPNVWLPISHDLSVNISLPGVKTYIKYTASIKYDELRFNNDLPIPSIIVIKNVQDTPPAHVDPTDHYENKKLEKLLEKEELNKREMLKMARIMKEEAKKADTLHNDNNKNEDDIEYKMDKDSLRNDSLNWEKIRPIPLNNEELKSYKIKDSIRNISKNEIDSLIKKDSNGHKAENEKNNIKKYLYKDIKLVKTKKTELKYYGILKLKNFGFNTVDGFYLNQSFILKQKIDSLKKLYIKPVFGYAINREEFMWELPVTLYYSPKRNGNLNIGTGNISTDFKGDLGENPFINMASSLLRKENVLKLYQKQYITIRNQINIADKLPLYISAEMSKISVLNNNSNFSIYNGKKEYLPNIPLNNIFQTDSFINHRSFVMEAGLTYKFKINHNNFKSPVFTLIYKKGIKGFFNSVTDYDMLDFRYNQKVKTGFFTEMDFSINIGKYINNNKIYFNDFKHFKSNYLPVTFNSFNNSFMNINDYYLSTNSSYINASYHIKSPYIILKYLPWINSRLWNENLYLNYLNTSDIQNYWEVGYAFTDIIKLLDFGVFSSFSDFQYEGSTLKLRIKIK